MIVVLGGFPVEIISGTIWDEDFTQSMAIVGDDCHQLQAYTPLGRCTCLPLLFPLSCPSFGLHGLFLIVGPLVRIFLVVVVVVVLARSDAFDWQLMVWYEVKWYGMVWYGMVCGMVLV